MQTYARRCVWWSKIKVISTSIFQRKPHSVYYQIWRCHQALKVFHLRVLLLWFSCRTSDFYYRVLAFLNIVIAEINFVSRFPSKSICGLYLVFIFTKHSFWIPFFIVRGIFFNSPPSISLISKVRLTLGFFMVSVLPIGATAPPPKTSFFSCYFSK